jgi:hypothetical protein
VARFSDGRGLATIAVVEVDARGTTVEGVRLVE